MVTTISLVSSQSASSCLQSVGVVWLSVIDSDVSVPTRLLNSCHYIEIYILIVIQLHCIKHLTSSFFLRHRSTLFQAARSWNRKPDLLHVKEIVFISVSLLLRTAGCCKTVLWNLWEANVNTLARIIMVLEVLRVCLLWILLTTCQCHVEVTVSLCRNITNTLY